MMEMELPGKRRFLDVVKKDMASWYKGDGR